jgi:nitrate reductase delta subunit
MSTLRALSCLLAYPDAELRQGLAELRPHLVSLANGAALEQLVDWLQASDELTLQERYVELFDRGRTTSLYLFEHLHGESRDRGGAMVDLADHFRAHGFEVQSGELPDYLPVVLEFASLLAGDDGKKFLAEFSIVIEAICAAHEARESEWVPVLRAVLGLCGAEAPEPGAMSPELIDHDAHWDEPAVDFGSACPAPH